MQYSWRKHIYCTVESQLRVESQQRDLAMSLAREVGAGQSQVFRQYERGKVEQTAQAGRLSSAVAQADKKVDIFEFMLHNTFEG